MTLYEQRKQGRQTIKELVQAVRTDNYERLLELLEQLDNTYLGWRDAFYLLGKEKSISPDMRAGWLRVWTKFGDDIRSEIQDDRVLIDGLRALLPPYRGPGLTLYRGDSAYNRRRRSYGPSWTSSRDAAEHFATGFWQSFVGGSVLLQTNAPPDAIVCAPGLHDNRYGEDEYLVDRRRLHAVTALQRYPQTPLARQTRRFISSATPRRR